MATTLCSNIAARMAELGVDDLEVARRIARRPWADREMTAEQERQFLRDVQLWQRAVRRWRRGRNEPRSAAQVALLAAALETTVEKLTKEEA